MKGWLTAALCLYLAAAPLYADTPVPDTAPTKLTDRVYVIQGPRSLPNKTNGSFTNNPVVVLTREGVVVIDPGGSLGAGEMILRQIKKLTKLPVVAVFNSHYHADHWMGNDAFARAYPKAPIYADATMIKAFKGGKGKEWYDRFMGLTEGTIKSTKLVGPTTAIEPGQSVKIGGLTFQTIHPEKSHTEGDLMVQIVEEGALFLSDTCSFKSVGRMDDGSFYGARDAMQVALDTGAPVMIPGHGPSGGREIAQDCANYYNDLLRVVIDRFREGEDQLSMKPKVLEAMSAYQDWREFDTGFGKHLSLSYLEVEEREF
ncbi:MAG: MBL fold metallo-hydrolase [bacterium]|nr:MBL fold metallo-hydrolase [bacterium]